MLSFHQIETFLHHTPPHLQEIVLELRNIIVSVAPDAAEVVRWGDLGYFHEGRGGIVSAGICQIGIHKEHVRLAFIHGAFLPDPRKLLCGTQRYKRFVEIDSYDKYFSTRQRDCFQKALIYPLTSANFRRFFSRRLAKIGG